MGKHCQLVIGPAGSGKSTYCSAMLTHCQTKGRTVHLVNLDPAAENFEYQPSIDIRDLVTLEDVMEELHYGPNGGLIFSFEYLLENIDWLEEALGDFDDDYLIIDCPGQIELYTHFPVMKSLCNILQNWGYRICTVYLLECQFIEDKAKFFSGVLSAMSAMIQLELPHINVLSKMDLLGDRAKSREFKRYLRTDPTLILQDANEQSSPKFHSLNTAMVDLIDNFSMVQFFPLNIKDEDSIEMILSQVDNAIQYDEDLEPKEPKDTFEETEHQEISSMQEYIRASNI